MKKIILMLTVIVLTNCAGNPFTERYVDLTGGADILSSNRAVLLKKQEVPQIYYVGDPWKSKINMLENGYHPLGHAIFNMGTVDEKVIISQAKKVHASAVTVFRKHTNTVSGSITLPSTQTQTTSTQGSVYGNSNFATYSGTSTTTVRGSTQTNIPYSIRRFDYVIIFWVKLKPPIFGLRVQPLGSDLRAKIESNQGIFIEAVVNGSPAYKAGIFKGDILKKVGMVDIYDIGSYFDAAKQYEGKKIKATVLRNGKNLIKDIQLLFVE